MTVYRCTWQTRFAPKGEPTTLHADFPTEVEALARAEQLVAMARVSSPAHVLVYALDVTP